MDSQYFQAMQAQVHRCNGVASKYLPNYLGWRDALDAGRVPTPQRLLRAALFSSSFDGRQDAGQLLPSGRGTAPWHGAPKAQPPQPA